MKPLFLVLGFFFTGLGFLGSVLPILPATPFFLVAAYLFAQSHPRLEGWLLSLPQVGPLLRSYRSGRGIPLRTKVLATLLATVAALLSAYSLPHPLAKGLTLLLVAYGIHFLWRRVPTLTPGESPVNEDLP
ncbi:hypothetical protein GCM10007092_14670 [Thermus composti]|uniref:YbaN family protein n=1 Tax=Thermus composti TaxID=532059 RepID=A0ABV6PZI6_9DEIN|nr:YbaN family protein [Thermus composti]GGN01598.1 hypothetical protein GCM10007092_14670 [Thermus composti]